jgi:hypothetical protein
MTYMLVETSNMLVETSDLLVETSDLLVEPVETSPTHFRRRTSPSEPRMA